MGDSLNLLSPAYLCYPPSPQLSCSAAAVPHGFKPHAEWPAMSSPAVGPPRMFEADRASVISGQSIEVPPQQVGAVLSVPASPDPYACSEGFSKAIYPNDLPDALHNTCEHLSEKQGSLKNGERQMVQYRSTLAYPTVNSTLTVKVPIPGRNPGTIHLVNSKQARRILIIRAKRVKAILERHAQGKIQTEIRPGLSSGKFTRVRTKDQVRAKVANQRQRVKGLFVSKEVEMQLKRRPKHRAHSGSDSETDDPD